MKDRERGRERRGGWKTETRKKRWLKERNWAFLSCH